MSLNLTTLSYQACRDIGCLRAGTQAVQAPDLLSDIRDAANQMLDAWRIEYLMAFSYPASIFPLQSALEQYKIGPGQSPPNFNAQRPDDITEANVIINFAGSNPTVRKQLILWGKSEWASISVRATTPGSQAPISAIPNGLYYDSGYEQANGIANINLWPAPGWPSAAESRGSSRFPDWVPFPDPSWISPRSTPSRQLMSAVFGRISRSRLCRSCGIGASRYASRECKIRIKRLFSW